MVVFQISKDLPQKCLLLLQPVRSVPDIAHYIKSIHGTYGWPNRLVDENTCLVLSHYHSHTLLEDKQMFVWKTTL